jgi:hypothetical protein
VDAFIYNSREPIWLASALPRQLLQRLQEARAKLVVASHSLNERLHANDVD